MSHSFVIQRFSRDVDLMGSSRGEWEAWMGSTSMLCTNGGISQATAGGEAGVAVACDGGEGGMRWVK